MRSIHVAALALLVAGACAACQPAQAERIVVTQDATPRPEPRTISVSGKATVTGTPDSFVVVYGVTVEAKSAKEAASLVDARVAKLLELSESMGVGEDELATDRFDLSPKTDYHDNHRIIGYEASRRITAKLGSPEKVSAYLPAIFESGANVLHSVTFESSKTLELRQKAQLEALAAARTKAASMAESLGQTLGEPMRIDSNAYGGSLVTANVYMGGASSAGITQSVAAGKVEISASVNVVFELTK